MKRLLTILIVLLSVYSYAQQKDCRKFKDGKFFIPDSGYGASHIERKGERQLEYGEGSGLRLGFKVEWQSECAYTLTLTEIIENPNNIKLNLGETLKVEIIEVKSNSYIQRSTMPGVPDAYESEMYLVE
jgi:hypothetical protein